MTNPVFDVVCFGAAVLDVRAQALGPVRQGSSNPVTSRTAAGGVARNVAECLARLGAKTALVSRMGRDAASDGLIHELDALGVDTANIVRAEDAQTATYTALLDQAGNLEIGLADMAVFDAMTPATLNLDQLPKARAWFLDTNLPTTTIGHLVAQAERPQLMAANAVSVEKAKRLKGHLEPIDLLYCNQQEFEALGGELARAVIITQGAHGALLQVGTTVSSVPALNTEVVDVTGAGDCAAAATLWALLQGRALKDAVALGQKAAALSLASARAVPDTLTAESLTKGRRP